MLETAASNFRTIETLAGLGTDTSVHKIQSEPKQVPSLSQLQSRECYSCGKQGHIASNCHFKSAKCHCGRTGHIKAVCRSTPISKERNVKSLRESSSDPPVNATELASVPELVSVPEEPSTLSMLLQIHVVMCQTRISPVNLLR